MVSTERAHFKGFLKGVRRVQTAEAANSTRHRLRLEIQRPTLTMGTIPSGPDLDLTAGAHAYNQ